MNIVSYYRVSTTRQGVSGLGLAAQEEIVRRFTSLGGHVEIASYTEVESAAKDNLENRPILQQAIMHCRRTRSVLVIAKLDRLSRSVYVTALLHKSGIEFLACDNPNANRMTVQIMAVMAEQEAKAISTRTKEALGALKARGTPLGAHNPKCRNSFSPEDARRGQLKGSQEQARRAREEYSDLVPIAVGMRQRGMSLVQIARELNTAGHTSRTGASFCPKKVQRLLSYV